MSSPSKEKKNKKKKDPETDTTWFLINCIMHSEAGKLKKINWDVIAEKLDIKTGQAASMRYVRLLNSYGLTGSYAVKGAGAAGSSPPGDLAASEPTTTVKKRKSNKRKRQDLEPEPVSETENASDEAKVAQDEAEDDKYVHDDNEKE